MSLKRIQIWVIPALSLWISPFSFPSMFFAELITKVVKIKKRKCFLNSNDFENKNERKPCFNSYSEKRKKNIFPAEKLSYSHEHMMQAILRFIMLRLLDVNIKLKY